MLVYRIFRTKNGALCTYDVDAFAHLASNERGEVGLELSCGCSFRLRDEREGVLLLNVLLIAMIDDDFYGKRMLDL